MKNIGKKLVEKYCKHQGYGNYSVDEKKLIKAINDALKKARQEGILEAQNSVVEQSEQFHCERFDFGRDKKCEQQCSDCHWMQTKSQ